MQTKSVGCAGQARAPLLDTSAFATAEDNMKENRSAWCCCSSRTGCQHSKSSEAKREARELIKTLWREAKPIRRGDEVDVYLGARKLALVRYPASLRCHPALAYYRKDASGHPQQMSESAALLACVQAPNGKVVTLHRTYVRDGREAFGAHSRKLLAGGIRGAAVRLFVAGERLSITKAIETALAVHLATGTPVWAALTAENLQQVRVPSGVRHVAIYADNDASRGFTGQSAAFVLARRLMQERGGDRRIEVFVPRRPGSDWADVWLRGAKLARAA